MTPVLEKSSRLRVFNIGTAVPVILMTAILAFPSSSLAASVPVKRTVMKNGLTLLVSRQPSLPIVSVEMIVRAGALHDPEGKEGLAALVADLLDEGTRTRSSTDIADAIDFVGGSMGTAGGNDYSSASLAILKKDIHIGLELLADVVLNPSFPEDELSRTRQETLAGLVAEKDDAGVVAMRAFNRHVFGDHPYHRPTEGTEESLPGITREDLVRFHDQYFRPNNAILSVVGDVTPKEAEALIRQHFGSWKSKPVPDLKVGVPSVTKGRVVELIDKDLTQANVVFGHVGIDRKNPDFYAVTVMNYILGGGGFSSRLLKEVRDNQGLAYSVYSRFAANFHPGSFVARLETKNQTAQQAIDRVMEEIERIRNAQVSETELSQAKAFLIGSFPLRMDTTGKISNLLTQIEFFDLGFDYFEEYPKKIDAVSREDVQRVARKYLSTEKFVLVVVADQAAAGIKITQ